MFGASDGLVTNVSLILGVAGAHTGGGLVRLAGFAGLLAGAFSMAAGEYISMKTQAELLQRELALEAREIRRAPRAEQAELAAIYESRGVDPAAARDLAAHMMRTPELALATHAREELGVNPESLGSPYQAAGSSFASFAVGAIIPLLPWFFLNGTVAVVVSVLVAAVAACAIGLMVGRATGRSMVRAAIRQLVVSMLAAGVTWGIGRLIGSSVSG